MSYLPRMSKTYKEPQQVVIEEEEQEEDLSGNTIQPASSLLIEGTHNPQMTLKQYRYLPHPPPVLPGPSVAEEAKENELSREASRLRRSLSKMVNPATSSHIVIEPPAPEETTEEKSEKVKGELNRAASRKSVKRSKSNLGKKKPSRSSLDKKKDSSKNDVTINTCLIDPVLTFQAAQTGDCEQTKKDSLLDKIISGVSSEEVFPKNKSEEKSKRKEMTNRSVQCTIFGSAEKKFVIPSTISSLLRVLAFLLHELKREEILSGNSGEKKSLMTQIQLILGDLCSQQTQKEFGFETTYSDSKRLEKILGDLQKYMKDVYGDKGEYVDRMDDLKRVFIELKMKEMELNILKDKLAESEELDGGEVVMKDSLFKNPEITLQNKRLESEQLAAEVEFSCRELRDYQKRLAEIDWEIKNCQGQKISLKKSMVSKSKTEIPGRKSSVHKFSSEALARGSKSRENENYLKKKT